MMEKYLGHLIARNSQHFLNMNKRGTFVIEDVILVILVIVFVTIIMVFVSKQSSNVYIKEEMAAKEIALAIDSARAGTEVKIHFEEYLDKMEEGIVNPIKIDNDKNEVVVQLSEKTGYRYGFFNDVSVSVKTEENYLIMEVR